MKRATPVLLAILLGAAVTALAMGVFLKLANDDRARLAQEINRAREVAIQALADKERIAAEASEKVEAANDEVRKAQEVLERLEEEQRLLATATPLSKPPTRELRGWTAVTSLPLGVSFMIPSTMAVLQNNEEVLRAATKGDEINGQRGWIDVVRASDEVIGAAGRNGLPATERAYLVDGFLLTVTDGTRENVEREKNVWVQKAGVIRFAIRIGPDPLFGTNGIERLLSTMEFAD